MNWVSRIRHRWHSYWPLSLAIGLMVYFCYHFIQGNYGILAWISLKENLIKAEQQFSQEQAVYEKLEHLVRQLRPENLDRDLLEERARLVLNFVQPNEVIILKKK